MWWSHNCHFFYKHRHFLSFIWQFFFSCILKLASTLNEILRIQQFLNLIRRISLDASIDINVHCTTAFLYYKQNLVSWEEYTLAGSLISSQPVETAIIVKEIASKYCDSGKIVVKKHIYMFDWCEYKCLGWRQVTFEDVDKISDERIAEQNRYIYSWGEM